MGRYMRKCKGIGEIAVMEVATQVGERTRARALAMAAASSGTAKRRKVGGRELNFSLSLVELRSRRQVVVSPATSGNNSKRRTASKNLSTSPSSDLVPASCCSSNGSSELAKESSNFTDLEVESVEVETSTYSLTCRERREMTPSSELQAESGELESTIRPSESNSRRRPTVEKMPSEAELEEFFVAAEKDLQKRFSEKYNYDIVKDVPLEGRYEWDRLKP